MPDAIDFVKACLEYGPLRAVEGRVPDYRDLTFQRRGGSVLPPLVAPKERIGRAFLSRLHRKPRPRDFEKITQLADL